MNSLQGKLLVASPKLLDPNFFRSVILLVQHGEEGALGLVINRPLDATIQAVWDQVSDAPCDAAGHLYRGGPCDGPLMVVHGDGNLSELEIVSGIFFSTEKEAIQRLVSENQCPMKFFVGYSGWGPGQLEHELDEGAWLTTPATSDQIFAGGEEQWTVLLRLITRAKTYPGLNPKIIPIDPSMN